MKHKFFYQKAAMLLFVVVYDMMVYYVSRLLAKNRYHYFLGFAAEEKIPLLPWTIYIYWGCYLFWIVNYILSVRGTMEQAKRFVLADLISKTVCFFFYVFLPTTMPRPEIVGTALSERLLRGLYAMDAADNLLPSIHCLVSWLSYIGIRGKKEVPSWYRVFSCVFALAVFVSTLTVKQHVFIDVLAGVLLAELAYQVAGRCCGFHGNMPEQKTGVKMSR